jgi:glycosyltransferase involved in cell wall biosynthesis
MRLLFVKDSLAWPRSSGHDVHTYHMMRALAALGHKLGLLTAAPPPPEAVAGLPLDWTGTFPPKGEGPCGPASQLGRLQEKFRGYWGVDPNRVAAVGAAADEWDADAVVVVGLGVLPYLGAVRGRARVWYAADEWFWHHASQVKLLDRRTWGELKQALVKGLYERVYRSLLDRVWVVTDPDRRAMRWVAGVKGIDVVPNGVDGDYYSPLAAEQGERTCTFWGRLDFGPNVQALEWFCAQVWPRVRAAHPDARFRVFGFNPTPPVLSVVGRDGIELSPDLPDLRAEVARQQVVVLPFVSGGGIKNKLLEAAAMGKPVVCSPTALNGLREPGEAGFVLARTPAEWADGLATLWTDAAKRAAAGSAARAWVVAHHSWETAARTAEAGLKAVVRSRLAPTP